MNFSIIFFNPSSILPLNIVNEKTYIFIWFWYIILLTMLVGLLIYRLLIIFVPSIRARVLNARNRMVPREIAVSVSNKVDIGDWWIIYMLGRNLDPIIYKDVLAELAKSISVDPKKSKNWRIFYGCSWKCSNLNLNLIDFFDILYDFLGTRKWNFRKGKSWKFERIRFFLQKAWETFYFANFC